MVSKYIKAIVLMHEQPLSNSNSGTCTFNDVYNKPLNNDRDCTYIDCDDCIFNQNNLISDIEAISHEQTN